MTASNSINCSRICCIVFIFPIVRSLSSRKRNRVCIFVCFCCCLFCLLSDDCTRHDIKFHKCTVACITKADIRLKHDDVIKWKHFPRHWPFVRGIHRSPVNSPHKSQWRGALMFSLICVWINGWINNREAGDLRLFCAHYDVNVMARPLTKDRAMNAVVAIPLSRRSDNGPRIDSSGQTDQVTLAPITHFPFSPCVHCILKDFSISVSR